MIDITCKIKVIAYADDKALPEILVLDSPNYSIIPPEVLDPLRLINGRVYSFRFREDATVKTFMNKVKHEMHEISPDYNYWDHYLSWSILAQERYYLIDPEQNFPYLLRKYFGYSDKDNIELLLIVSANAGEICRIDGLQYYMHSRERGRHNLPHVHVNTTDHNQDVVISIADGAVLEGALQRKLLKKAQKLILDNQKYFYECWNAYTDGIRVDINNHFNVIGY